MTKFNKRELVGIDLIQSFTHRFCFFKCLYPDRNHCSYIYLSFSHSICLCYWFSLILLLCKCEDSIHFKVKFNNIVKKGNKNERIRHRLKKILILIGSKFEAKQEMENERRKRKERCRVREYGNEGEKR